MHARDNDTVRMSLAFRLALGFVHELALEVTRVCVLGLTRVCVLGLTRVCVLGLTRVCVLGFTRVRAFGFTRVRAFGVTRVHAFGVTRVHAFGVTRVHARGVAHVHARGVAHVLARGVTRVRRPGIPHERTRRFTRVLAPGLSLVLLFAMPRPAHAGRHTMEPGETIEHVALAYGCTVEAVMRANRLDTVLVKAGTVVKIPVCNLKTRARTRERITGKSITDSDRARQALAVIDGTTLIASARDSDEVAPGDGNGNGGGTSDEHRNRNGPAAGGGMSVLGPPPANAKLRNSERLSSGEGYRIRRPTRAFGAPHVVEHLRDTIAIVRALYPEVHTLAIGDISAEHGGRLANHLSHQTGVDVDVGFYFHRQPAGYPDHFVAANDDLDVEATWALVTAFARTSHLDDGVQMIFLDYDVQARLHAWARKRGTPDDQLAALLQYPRGKDALSGLVRHWPNHADHLHVRFKGAR